MRSKCFRRWAGWSDFEGRVAFLRGKLVPRRPRLKIFNNGRQWWYYLVNLELGYFRNGFRRPPEAGKHRQNHLRFIERLSLVGNSGSGLTGELTFGLNFSNLLDLLSYLGVVHSSTSSHRPWAIPFKSGQNPQSSVFVCRLILFVCSG